MNTNSLEATTLKTMIYICNTDAINNSLKMEAKWDSYISILIQGSKYLLGVSPGK